VEEALNKGIGSFQELLRQQKDTLILLQQECASYTGQASMHPSVAMVQRAVGSDDGAGRSHSTQGFLRQVTKISC
jgi:hypothetical protein